MQITQGTVSREVFLRDRAERRGAVLALKAEGLNAPQIAERLSMPVNTVRSVIAYARRTR